MKPKPHNQEATIIVTALVMFTIGILIGQLTAVNDIAHHKDKAYRLYLSAEAYETYEGRVKSINTTEYAR